MCLSSLYRTPISSAMRCTYHRVLQVRSIPSKVGVDHIEPRRGTRRRRAGAADRLRVPSERATKVGVSEGELLELVAVQRVVDGLLASGCRDADGPGGGGGGQRRVGCPVPVRDAESPGGVDVCSLCAAGVLLGNGLCLLHEELLVAVNCVST